MFLGWKKGQGDPLPAPPANLTKRRRAGRNWWIDGWRRETWNMHKVLSYKRQKNWIKSTSGVQNGRRGAVWGVLGDPRVLPWMLTLWKSCPLCLLNELCISHPTDTHRERSLLLQCDLTVSAYPCYFYVLYMHSYTSSISIYRVCVTAAVQHTACWTAVMEPERRWSHQALQSPLCLSWLKAQSTKKQRSQLNCKPERLGAVDGKTRHDSVTMSGFYVCVWDKQSRRFPSGWSKQLRWADK